MKDYKIGRNIICVMAIPVLLILVLTFMFLLLSWDAKFVVFIVLYFLGIFIAPPCFALSLCGLFFVLNAFRAREKHALLWMIIGITELAIFFAIFCIEFNFFYQATMGT